LIHAINKYHPIAIYISDDALDEYAELVLKDTMPDVLKYPQPLDVERFVEYYLGMQVDFRQLSKDRKILGMTAFNTGYMQIISEETGEPEPMPVTAGTVVIDPILTKKRNIPRFRFTTMHEGSHWLIHRKAFAEGNPMGNVGKFENQFLAAKEGRIDYCRDHRERTDIDRIERQADFLSSASLMPKTTLRMAYRDFFKRHGEKPRAVIIGKSPFDDFAFVQLPVYMANQYNVSKQAAFIRLEKLRAIVERPSMWDFCNRKPISITYCSLISELWQ